MNLFKPTVLAIAALLAGCSSDSASRFADPEACLALADKDFGFTKVRATWREGNATQNLPTFARLGLPAYCSVDAVIRPVPGSRIRVVYRLPERWNGKVYGIGGGGWAGDISLLSARDALGRGFATMQTDAGKSSGDVRSPDVYDNTWLAYNWQAVTDFSHRAIHEMTVAGKRVAAAYYGRQPDSARFVGCSAGGRMALMEAQRYPGDYDEIIAGSPVYTLQTQTTALMAGNLFAAPGAAMSRADLQLATRSAVAACDAADGLEDGLINDPRTCHWDPATIQCLGDKASNCLAKPQVTALQTLYRGLKSPDGQWALWPVSRGGETTWSVFVNTSGTPETDARGLGPLKPLMFPDREVDWAHFSEVTDAPQVRGSEFAGVYEAKDPDLSRFFARGGKLLMWGGESDVGPAPAGAIEYAEAVIAANARAAQQFRFFLVPGVGHCGGRFGADLLPLEKAADSWVQSGTPPGTLVATMRERSLTRPVCAWPKVARYDGKGDPDASASWRCVARQS
jgi:feruloyl esterase